MQKTLKLLCRDEFPQQALLNFHRYGFRVNKLPADSFANPKLFLFALYVAIFDPHLTAVGALQNLQYLPQRATFPAAQAPCNKLPVEIPDGQTVSLNVQFGVVKNRQRMKRIDIGNQVAAHAIGINQLNDTSLLDRLLAGVIS